MADATADIHVTRAIELLKKVETETDSLRTQIASLPNEDDMPLAALFRKDRAIRARREELLRDVSLAERELAAVRDGSGDPSDRPQFSTLRAGVGFARATIELVSGSPKAAREHFNRSIAEQETADAWYWLGMLNESEYKPSPALERYERCLALEPNGECSLEALRAADRMRNYRKAFRGSWKTMLLWFLFFFPYAPFYWWKNYK